MNGHDHTTSLLIESTPGTGAGLPARPLPVAMLLISLLLVSGAVFGQVPVDESGKPLAAWPEQPYEETEDVHGAVDDLDSVELQELVGPIALYPDDLLAIILPASTYPLEIVQAARFLDELEADNSLEPDETWDDAVVALLNYPEVVRMMDDEIDWTWRLGEAVLARQSDVIAAVEAFRDRAYAAGNLRSDERQDVSYEDGVIEIAPVDDEIIYVPYYEPAEVVISQPRRVYYYYPDPYPVYYYPYPTGYRFRTGFFWGVTTAYTIGWPNHYLHVYHPSYWGHPYYGRYYYGHYYRRPSITVYNTWYVDRNAGSTPYRYRDGDRWRHRRRSGTTVVNKDHYASNGSRNSRDFTVTRRDRIRAGSDAGSSPRRDPSRATLTSSRSSTTERDRSAPSSRNREPITFRDRGIDRSVGNTSRQGDTRRVAASTRAQARRDNTGSAIQFRERRESATTRPAISTRAIRSTRQDGNDGRTRAAPANTRRTNAATVTRPTTSTRRQASQPASRRPSVRSSGGSRVERAPAPATVRAPAATRAGTRSSNRGGSRPAPERRSNTQRIRPNND